MCLSPDQKQQQRYYPTYLNTKNAIINQDKKKTESTNKAASTLMRSYINHKPPTGLSLLANGAHSAIQHRKLHHGGEHDTDDSIDSADCDEKRSYTPEPRSALMNNKESLLTNKETKKVLQLNHSMIGLSRSGHTP